SRSLFTHSLFHVLLLFFLLITPPPRSTLFPYTTLFRSFNHRTPLRERYVLAVCVVFHRRLTSRATAYQARMVAPFDLGSFALRRDRKSTRLNSSHGSISYAVFCLKKKII